MDLIASFSSQKVDTFHFFLITGLLGDDDLAFLFDPGAVCPLIGVNCFFRKDKDATARKRLEKIVHDELTVQNVPPRSVPLKAANSQKVVTFPCVCHNVSIENTARREFFFDLSFDEISIPLLGSSFTDDCAYRHSINGNLDITGIKADAGARYYKGTKVLNFDVVATKYEGRLQ